MKNRNHLGFIACGTIRTNPKNSFSERLLEIYKGLSEVISLHQPEVSAIEDMFVSHNPQTALKLGQARGVAVIAAMRTEMKVFDYTARMVKQSVVGYGQAEKSQVQHMVKALLGLSKVPSSDAADALAVAICHANHLGNQPGQMTT